MSLASRVACVCSAEGAHAKADGGHRRGAARKRYPASGWHGPCGVAGCTDRRKADLARSDTASGRATFSGGALQHDEACSSTLKMYSSTESLARQLRLRCGPVFTDAEHAMQDIMQQ